MINTTQTSHKKDTSHTPTRQPNDLIDTSTYSLNSEMANTL